MLSKPRFRARPPAMPPRLNRGACVGASWRRPPNGSSTKASVWRPSTPSETPPGPARGTDEKEKGEEDDSPPPEAPGAPPPRAVDAARRASRSAGSAMAKGGGACLVAGDPENSRAADKGKRNLASKQGLDRQLVRHSTTGMKPVSIVPQSDRSFQPLCKESFLSFLSRLVLSLQIETNERLGELQCREAPRRS